MHDDRLAFEDEEIRGWAQQHGAVRGETADGIGYWRFPPWVCSHCGPDVEALSDCPQPLARHGPIEREG